MSLRDLATCGLQAVTSEHNLPVWALSIAGLGALAFVKSIGPHGVFCACPDCNPQHVTRELNPLPPEDAATVISTLGPVGPPRRMLGHHHYHVPFDPLLADKAQAALARVGNDLARNALIDRLYLEYERAEPALAKIPWNDPRARTWIVVGALSGIPPRQIDRFVRSYGRA